MAVLECKDLSKHYGNAPALNHVSLAVEPGRIVGLLGPNGSGKTTLIKLANGLLTPSEGEVLVCDMAPGKESHASVSYLPERTCIPTWMSVKQLLDFYGDFYRDFNRKAAEEMLTHLNIRLTQRIKQMSKGTREKVQLIMVMSRAAKLYLLTDLASVFPKLFQQMTAYYAVNGTVFALELLALMLAACMSFSLQFYAALAAGHSFANHKMALSVAFFFVFQFVVQMAGAIVLVLLDEGPLHQFLLTLDFQLTGVAAVHFTMVALLLLTVLYGAIFYIVTTITLKKRLNLE